MAKELLVDTQVRTARPKANPYYLRDGESLYCLVRRTQDGASKLWQFFFKWQGKTARLSLGAYPEVSLKDARKRRDKAKEELAGDPPMHPRLEALRRTRDKIAGDQAAAAEKTVRDLFDDWQRSYLASNRRDG
ncbi:MAG: Arm DNA-binding domain-containing protein, partial [Burkholderiales bacterium]